MEAERKSADPTLTLSTALQRAMGPAKPARPFSSGTRGNLSGTPASSSAIVRLFLPLSPSLCLSVSLSLCLSLSLPTILRSVQPRITRVSFSALLLRTVCTMEGARGRRRRRRTSREPEPSVLRISQLPLRVCAGTTVCVEIVARAQDLRCCAQGSIARSE